MAFCIPKHLVTKLKESAINKEVDIQKLYDMSSKERRDFFTKYTDKELGKFINTEFEKAVVSNKKDAITEWAKGVFAPSQKKKPVFKNVLDKINSLDELGVLSPKGEKVFLEDLVADKLGVTVSPEEVKVISKKAKKIEEAQVKLGDELGNPNKLKENVDYFIAKKEMDDYLSGLVPASKVQVLTGTIGRGAMLASVKSPILNIGANIEVGFTEALTRRIADGQIRGADNGLAKDYVKMANVIYQKSGYDISRMTSLEDGGVSGGRVLGDTIHSQGKGAIRKVGRVAEDVVFKQLMGAPDVAFASAHYADSINLNAMKLAEGNKVKAKAMMEDAMRLNPKTAEGEIIRAQGILDAQKATWTNKTWASTVSEGIRGIFNKVSGDLRAGDYFLPYVTTPANVIATGMDYAGLGIPKALFRTVNAVRTGNLKDKNFIRGLSRDLVRSGIGIAGAYILTQQFDDDDFVGAYDPGRAQIQGLRNANYNAFRIGGGGLIKERWISADWFGPLSVPMSAMMYARQRGETKGERTFQYSKNVLGNIAQIPGVADAYDYAKSNSYKKDQNLSEMSSDTAEYITSEAHSRLVPSIVSDIAKAVDPNVRETTNAYERVKSRLPFVSKTLPVKEDVFGKEIKGESAVSDILFGSRVKTDRETPLTKELLRLSNEGDSPIRFTDWDKSSSDKLAKFRELLGEEEFKKAKRMYGRGLEMNLNAIIESPEYQQLNNEDRYELITKIDNKVQDAVYKKYNYQYRY